MKFIAVFIYTVLLTTFSFSQTQTVGIFLNTPYSSAGYTLLAPLSDTTTYLIDNCGRIVHTWSSNYNPGLSAYLLPDGTLLRPTSLGNSSFGNQGGGRVEKVDWNGNIIWEYFYSNSQHHQHHDIAPMPNGNVLLLAFEYKSPAEIITNGRNPATAGNGLWPEHIIEVQPVGADSGVIVWEWHSWDHIIQQFDSTLPGYGNVSDHPELLDINYRPSKGNVNQTADWLHGNSIDYNASMDQIVISSRTFSELMIIDHQTSSAEAASHNGGKNGRGGDILYRWGNPEAYGRGDTTDQKLFFQHNVHWIPEGYKGAGNLLLFNNGFDRPGGNHSSVDEIITTVDSNGIYPHLTVGTYDPPFPVWSYTSSQPSDFYSPFISGAQRLPNGNTLICEGMTGHLFEVDSSGNKVWDYISPVNSQGRISQGAPATNNLVFRAYRYSKSYAAFTGKTLTPGGYIEQNPSNYNCNLYSGRNSSEISSQNTFEIYPNPSDGLVKILLPSGVDQSAKYTVNITDIFGREVFCKELQAPEYEFNICDIAIGLYYCTLRDKNGSLLKTARLIRK